MAPVVGQGFLDAPGFGRLHLTWSKKGLVSLAFPETFEGSYGQGASKGDAPPEQKVPEIYAKPLLRYFGGEPVEPAKLPVDLQGTVFQRRVWEALRHVPRGRVRSYASIATDVHAPRAMRAVGMANSKNPIPIVVPCHRIVEQGNRLGGYSGG
ncbi:MAG: methylated-DNA--[protein]-cysteine S-methyltransferase, partial [Myxococcales bacterium]|nr:methylated-DNA--[protein]-cysteine S-methyltransferase [Myxococcales bacterium]